VESRTRTVVEREPPVLLAGRFEVRGVLGEGAFGVVYLAFDRVLEREVALKFVRSTELADGDAKARFLREAHALSAVSHPNVVTVYDLGETEGDLYLCLERIRGSTLKEILRGGSLPVPEAAAIGRDLLSALEAIHAADLVHRDVKPGNVMLDAAGRVKLMDFGLAKGTHRPLDLTSQEVAVGTPLYMAPEQWLNRRATPQTDLFSLGVLLYEMVAGTSPFPGRTVEEVQDAILYGTPRPLAEVRDGVPATLASVVERALRKEPEERFASASEMRAALPPPDPGLDRTGVLRRRAAHHPAAEARPLTEEQARSFAEKAAPTGLRLSRRAVLALGGLAAAAGVAAVFVLRTPADLEVSFSAYRQGATGREPLAQGAAVHHRDEIFFEIQSLEELYVYIYNRSPNGEQIALFPTEGAKAEAANPFPSGRTHRFPPSGGAYQMDAVTGEEVFYLFASRRRDRDLEWLLRAMRQVVTVDDASSRALQAKVGKTRGVQQIVKGPRSPSGGEAALQRLVGPGRVVGEFRLNHR